MTDTTRVRQATVPELPDVLNVLDGAMLDVDSGRLRGAIDDGDVLVAVAGGPEPGTEERSSDERVLGALALDGEEITAVAVRQRRRGQGIGTRLVEAAADRRERVVAEFDPRVHSFWSELGFDSEPVEGGRYRGIR